MHEDDRGVLGHQRLAIVDLDNGGQPLLSDTPPARALVANGAIYNAAALRERLAARHRYGTASDSEAVLHLSVAN